MHSCALVLLCSGALLGSAAAETGSNLLERANAAYRDQRAGEAVALYREYLAGNPDRADVRIFLGASFLSLGRYADALREADRAIRLDASAGRAYTLAGRIYAAERYWDAAQAQFAKAASLNRSDREVPYFAGRAFFDANQFGAAVNQFRKAIQLGAREGRVFENLALSLEALNRPDEAGEAYRRAIESGTAGQHTFLLYGLFLYKQNRLEESVPMLVRSMQLAPDSVETRFALGRLLFHQNKIVEAEAVLSSARASNDCRVHNLLLQLYSAMKAESEVAVESQALRTCSTP